MATICTYAVKVDGFPAVTFSATSPAQARTEAWRHFTGAYDCTFKDFLRISKVYRCAVPEDDGYGCVRRHYGVDPKIGGRVRLINEGPSTGLEGEIVYPGQSTAHVHVVIDGRKHAVCVHPLNIEFVKVGE